MIMTNITSGEDRVSSVKASRGRPMPGGGYCACPALISVHSAGAAVYLDIESDGSQKIELAVNSEQALDLICALHEHLKNHAERRREVDSILDQLEV